MGSRDKKRMSTMQMGTWGKWALASSRHLEKLAPGQKRSEANRRWSKWAPKQRGTGGKRALEKRGTRACEHLGHIKLPILPQVLVCSSVHPFQYLFPPAPICPKYPFSFGVDLPLFLFYPSAEVPISPRSLLVPYLWFHIVLYAVTFDPIICGPTRF